VLCVLANDGTVRAKRAGQTSPGSAGEEVGAVFAGFCKSSYTGCSRHVPRQRHKEVAGVPSEANTPDREREDQNVPRQRHEQGSASRG